MAKRLRQAEKRRLRNRAVKTRAKKASTRALAAVDAGDQEQAGAAVREAQRMLDRAAGKGVIHKKATARRKSRLMKKLIAAAPTPAETTEEPAPDDTSE